MELTGEFEWYTPPEYIELARTVLGNIDLDPASNAQAQKTVRADRYFTAADDGLTQEWRGRVWLNPPYSQPLISHFIKKLVDEVGAGNVTEAVLLTHKLHRHEMVPCQLCSCVGSLLHQRSNQVH
jgi:hypothetical protein